MPELPDVEIFRRYIGVTAFRKKIKKVQIENTEILEGVSSSGLKKALEGDSFVMSHRHGKYLFLKGTKGKWLMLHFGMTGFPKYFKAYSGKPEHSRLLIHFANSFHLSYDSQRKLGRIGLTDDPDSFIQEKNLGPDALDPELDFDTFQKIVKNTRAKIKPALMNQKYLAGIGNIYSDEILFQAKIHPGRTSNKLDKDEMKRLYFEMDHVLKTAIECRADPGRFPASFIIPHRRGDQICPKCKGGIQKMKAGGRTAYYCPSCQKK